MTPHFFILKVQVHVEDDPARIFKATEVGTNITQVINVILNLCLRVNDFSDIYIHLICILRLKNSNIVTCPQVAVLIWVGHVFIK